MQSSEEQVVQNYQSIVQRAEKYFAGLRELPANGGKFWMPYYAKTFETYTALWKYQQEHRRVLESKKRLKRYEIGDIAAKIGQLFYQYYLRTSDTNYLQEAFIFYEAIHERAYFKEIIQTGSSSMFTRKLRYYARFIVVCLLQNKRSLVANTLLPELTTQVQTYKSTFPHAQDILEWSMVLQEIDGFLKSDTAVTIGNIDNLSYRLKLNNLDISNEATPSSTPSLLPAPVSQNSFKLAEALIVGNRKTQVKFSELTLDMFRVMQSLEILTPMKSASESKGNNNMLSELRKRNPRKSVLYRPTFSEFIFVLSTAFMELPSNSALLLYVSADAVDDISMLQQPSAMATNHWSGSGILLNSKKIAPAMPTTVSQQRNDSNTAKTPTTPTRAPADLRPLQVQTRDVTLQTTTASQQQQQLQHQQQHNTPQKQHHYHGGYPLNSPPSPTTPTPYQRSIRKAASSTSVASSRQSTNPSDIFSESDVSADDRNSNDAAAKQMLPQRSGTSKMPFDDTVFDVVQQQQPPSASVSELSEQLSIVSTNDASLEQKQPPLSVSLERPPSQPTTNSKESAHSPIVATRVASVNTPPAMLSCNSNFDFITWNDLLPFSRKPMFLIVESTNSSAIKPTHNQFGAPLVCLLSPRSLPLKYQDYSRTGSAMTYFLSAPIAAFYWVSNPQANQIFDELQYSAATAVLDQCFANLQSLIFETAASIDPSCMVFFECEFTRAYILRFIFCCAVFRHHTVLSSNPEFMPQSYPVLPTNLLANGIITDCIKRLAEMLGVQKQYSFPSL